jgi:putative endonuclease
MTDRRQLGNQGEAAVASWLETHGFTVLARNLYSRWGELDIVAERRGQLHVVEVKTRRSLAAGLPQEAWTAQKLGRVRRTVWTAQQAGLLPNLPYQLDLAAVTIVGRQAKIILYWNIFG